MPLRMARINAFLLSYNHPEHTRRAALSLLKIGAFEKYYLIHNGSQEKHIQLLQSQLPNFEHILMPENKGYAGGMNRAIEILCSTESWGFFLTNDCTLEFLHSPPQSKGFWAPTIFFRKMDRIDSYGGSFFPRKGLLTHRKELSKPSSSDKRERFYIPGSAFWLDSESAQQGGLFESKLGTYWEDVDLSQRYQEMNIPVGYDANTQVLHRGGKTCHKDPLYTLYFYQRNRAIISRRYCPRGGLARFTLECHLWTSWAHLAVRLVQKKRFADLRFLSQAIRDSWRYAP